MPIDLARLNNIFDKLGVALKKQPTLCLIGSTPGIATGQPDRQTPDLDVWFTGSHYDISDLTQACEELGILYDPKGELDPDAVYIQVVRPGIVNLPAAFDIELIGTY